MLIVSLVCTGLYGALQERTYSTYGPCWRESVFYTVRVRLTMNKEKERERTAGLPIIFLNITPSHQYEIFFG